MILSAFLLIFNIVLLAIYPDGKYNDAIQVVAVVCAIDLYTKYLKGLNDVA